MKFLKTFQPSFPSVLLINAQSLFHKVDDLRVCASLRQPNVICIAETWLHSCIDSALIHIPRYSICRTDRLNRRGGGTCIFIDEKLHYQTCTTNLESQVFEMTVVDLVDLSLIVICLYVPPNLSSEILSETESFICDACDCLLSDRPNHHLIIAGDTNALNTESLCESLALFDLVKKPTRGMNTLDHILVSNDLNSQYSSDRVQYDAPLGNADHKMILASPLNNLRGLKLMTCRKLMDLRLSNLQYLHHELSQANWSVIEEIEDPNEQWNVFLNVLSLAMEKCIPTRSVVMLSKEKGWMTPLIKSLVNDRWAAYRQKNWNLFAHLKSKVKKEILKAKKNWAMRQAETPRGLWRLVRSESREENTIGKLVMQYGSISLLIQEISSVLSSTFANNAKNEPLSSFNDAEWNLNVCESEVFALLSRISESKACGVDGIPSRVYKQMASILSRPLAFIFNSSLTTKRLPQGWKQALIVPVPKTSPPNINKLRFISLLPVPSKILEKLILGKLKGKFESEYGQLQHGFRSKHSTTTALIDLVDQVTRILDKKEFAGAAVLSYDLSSAFDNVSHALILKCLQEKGFPDGFVSWMASYLHGRTAIVKIGDEFSGNIQVLKGVPQGSILAPSLFCTFIASLGPISPLASAIKYADDMNIVLPLTSTDPMVIHNNVNEETRHIMSWCNANELQLNVGKSKMLVLSNGHIPSIPPTCIPQVKELRVLGVTLDEKLTWKAHVRAVSSVASRRLYVLRRLKHTLSTPQLHSIHICMIRSILEYASACFIGIGRTLTDKLNKIDARCHRIIYSISLRADYKPACACPKSAVEDRRHKACMKLFKQIEASPEHILHTRLPHRSKKRYLIPYSRTTKRLNSFFPRVAQMLNDA